MTATTRLEPMPADRARQVLNGLLEASADERNALALDGLGYVTGVVRVDDPKEEHLLGDLDVHA